MYVCISSVDFFLSIITTRVFELRHAKIASFLIFVKFISVNMLTKAKYPFGQNTGQSREFITQPSYQYVRMIICPAVCGWPHKSFRRAQITHNRFSKRSALLRFPFHHREKFALETNSLGWLGEKGRPTFTYENQSESWDWTERQIAMGGGHEVEVMAGTRQTRHAC